MALQTHNVSMVAPIADFVISLTMDGSIASQGTLNDALKLNKELAKEVVQSKKLVEKDEETIDNEAPGRKTTGSKSKLIVEEEIAAGHVSWRSMKLYLSGMGGPLFWSFFLVATSLSHIGTSFQSWWLGHWAAQYNGQPAEAVPVAFYLSTYALLVLGFSTIWIISMSVLVFGGIRVCISFTNDNLFLI